MRFSEVTCSKTGEDRALEADASGAGGSREWFHSKMGSDSPVPTREDKSDGVVNPEDDTVAQVLVSYSRKDTDFVCKLNDALVAQKREA